MLISVDFDGTCVTHMYPHIGKNIGAEIVLKAISNAGHKIICTSMRSDSDKERHGIDTVNEAKKWFNDNGIKLYAFNDNPSQDSWTDSRKIYAHTYIDDQFLGCPLKYDEEYSSRPFVNWQRASLLLSGKQFIPKEEIENVLNELYTKYPYLYKEPKLFSKH